MTISEYLVDLLLEKGVTDVFGLPGGVVLDFLYALDKRDGIAVHLNYHEQGAAFAACGYAQVNHKLGVAYATRGPGFTNLITGIADAYSDSIPVLFITAHSGKAVGHRMRFEKDQELDTVTMVKHITKYAVVVDSAEAAFEEINKACESAMEGRKGPVLLDFSDTLWNQEIKLPEKQRREKTSFKCKSAADRIVHELESAQRPILLLGDGIWQSGTARQAAELSKKINIPVLSSRCAQDVGAICENYYGYAGSHGIRYSNFIFSKADLVISLGNRLAFPATSESYLKALGNKQIIRIDRDEQELTREIFHSHVFQCDLEDMLPELLKRDDIKTEWTEWLDTCKSLKNRLNCADLNEAVKDVALILQRIHRDTILVSDVGNNEFWVSRGYEFAGCKCRNLYSKSFGALGCALGKAIGAYFSEKKPVVCFVGDQGLQLNIQELQTIAQERLPILIVLMNNNSSGMIYDREKHRYKDHYVHTTRASGYGNPDFKRIAGGYGIDYICWDGREPLGCFEKIDRPLLVELLLDEEISLAPGLPKGNPMQKMIPELEETLYLQLDGM